MRIRETETEIWEKFTEPRSWPSTSMRPLIVPTKTINISLMQIHWIIYLKYEPQLLDHEI